MFKGKKVTVGITGGIAAYKAADLVSWLRQNHAEVQVIMTQNATEIITPLTLKTLSGRPVATDLMDQSAYWNVPHIDCAQCDLFAIIPATANSLAKAAHGLADDILSSALLATSAPVVYAPAMHADMYQNPATQANLRILEARGWRRIEPGYGRLACGAEGQGRLAELDKIKEALTFLLNRKPYQDPLPLLGKASLLAGKKVLITAGPTYEYVDPVRFLGNRSSGKMGYALAEAARNAGGEVTLVSGPTALAPPLGVEIWRVTSAAEMYDAVWEVYPESDIVIMAAAVADYRPADYQKQKIKKGGERLLQLEPNPDILASLGKEKGARILVGFAAETENLAHYAEEKLRQKNLDLIIANNVALPGAGFEGDTNIISILAAGSKEIRELPLMRKEDAAALIIEAIGDLPRFPQAIEQKEGE